MFGDIVKLIDDARRNRVEPIRGHLGASQIGDKCLRATWYAFRWAYIERHTGRLLRLFDRGHDEEFRFVRYLREAGAEIREFAKRTMYHEGSDSYGFIDWDDLDSGAWAECDDVSEDERHIRRAGPRQWGFTDHDRHFGGSCDGQISWPGVLPDGWGLLECKTHGDKSFKDLSGKGVLQSKPTHYTQMQVYMHYLGLPWGLYIAVNKNDDTLYAEIVWAKPEMAEQLKDRAGALIASPSPPQRYSDDPSWFVCRYCAYREICHYGKEPHKNCRSCAMATPGADGSWYCQLHRADIPKEFLTKGCDQWEAIG